MSIGCISIESSFTRDFSLYSPLSRHLPTLCLHTRPGRMQTYVLPDVYLLSIYSPDMSCVFVLNDKIFRDNSSSFHGLTGRKAGNRNSYSESFQRDSLASDSVERFEVSKKK